MSAPTPREFRQLTEEEYEEKNKKNKEEVAAFEEMHRVENEKAAERAKRHLLVRMYGEEWREETLNLLGIVKRGHGMVDKDACELAEGITEGAFPKLEYLWLDENDFTDTGVLALAEAVRSGKAPKLTSIDVAGMDHLSDSALAALLAALKSNADAAASEAAAVAG
jgi:hypothetical protein